MNDDLRDFEAFMMRRDQAARAYVSGDAAPLGGIVAHTLPATFFAPDGGYEDGATEVASRYERDAALFASGDSKFEILQLGASNGIAYWVGFQRATVHLHGKAEAVPFNLRVTEIFRREGDEWKLVHRHADTLTDEART
jgi:hypothetical protein